MLTRWGCPELTDLHLPEQVIRKFETAAQQQLGAFYKGGGEVIFGTDVGYRHEFDTTYELTLMQQAGMSFDGILASLTSNPSKRFAKHDARVEPGAAADLVVVSGDPRTDITALARVCWTARRGQVLFHADACAQ